ncbi:hypothetical protein ACF0H5_007723 [Mactra antiquata]
MSDHSARITSEKLLKATKNKEYGYTETLLSESHKILIDTTDDVGKTTLHYLCNAGRKTEIQLCLKWKPNVNKVDKIGWTPLHYAAMKGHEDIIHILVKYGADPNKRDHEKGRTALHLAVSRNHQNIVEQLIQLGADPNVTDQDGKTATDISKNEFMKDKIVTLAKKKAEENEEKKKEGESIGISEKMDIQPDKPTPFLNLGLTVIMKLCQTEINTSGSDVIDKSFTMSIRKLDPDLATESFDIKEDEDICSELFIHKLLNVSSPITVDIQVPITLPPSNNEELVLKTDKHDDILADDVKEENGKWYCIVSAEITSFTSFIVISRPKLEKFNIGKAAANIKSTIDERVELEIPNNTFDKSVTITMGITTTPDKDELTQVMSQCDLVSSTTSFYSLDSGGTTLCKPVSLKVPLPTTYKGDGQLVVLTMNDDPDEETPDSWKPLSTIDKIQNERIYFDVPSFSIKVVVETPTQIDDISQFGSTSSFGSIASQVSRIYRKCRRREYAVTLVCLSRRIGTSNTFRIITLCCKVDQAEPIISGWESEGFECHTKLNEHSTEDELKVKSKQKFKVVARDLKIIAGDKGDHVIVEFQPRLETSHKSFNVVIPYGESMASGVLSFTKLEKADVAVGQTVPKEQELVDGDVVSTVKVSFLMFHPSMLSKLDGTSFLSYKRMIEIQSDLGDRWWKCLLLMEIPFKALEESFADSTGNQQETVNGLLFDWRERHRSYKSRGVPIMLSALSRCGKRDLVKKLQIQLRQWKETSSHHSDVFYDWLMMAYKYDLLVPTCYDPPMSDTFLAMIADKLKPRDKLEATLKLSKGTLKYIRDNKKCYPCDGLITMKLLDEFRKSYSDQVKAFGELMRALKESGQTDVASYALMMAEAWLKRQDVEQNEFFDVIIKLSSKT